MINEPVDDVRALRHGVDPDLDAWLLHFMTENNLEHLLSPELNASTEQLKFMVALEDDQFFVPCSDELFRQLLMDPPPRALLRAYNTCWRVLMRMVLNNISERYQRRRILQFCRHRFRLALSSHIIIPSRLMKRMAHIFISQSGVMDPYREERLAYNMRAATLLGTSEMDHYLNACPASEKSCSRLDELRWDLAALELKRLFVASTREDLWLLDEPDLEADDMCREIEETGADWDVLRDLFGPGRADPGAAVTGMAFGATANVLYIPGGSGSILFDLKVIQSLLRMGHRVMLSLKKDFYFQSSNMWDVTNDPVLAEALDQAHVVRDERISKNGLLALLREHRFLVIHDGTQERLNLNRVNVTFARAWKEADVVLAKGDPNQRRLIGNSHPFTRDVLCVYREVEGGGFRVVFKPKSPQAVKFTEADLREQAEIIIRSMREAKAQGKTVMFYSAIVGSIPGQVDTAIQVLKTFVGFMREKQAATFIINPAEHFIEGMDGDDLMYMWEIVQRSGLIDVWRFQTSRDIEKSFELMGHKVPPAWAGKDATFSTGCTKEMRIALDVQRLHGEMQIIGPSPENFSRRLEYGVGKYFDATINA